MHCESHSNAAGVCWCSYNSGSRAPATRRLRGAARKAAPEWKSQKQKTRPAIRRRSCNKFGAQALNAETWRAPFRNFSRRDQFFAQLGRRPL